MISVFTGYRVDRDPRQRFVAHRCEGSLRRRMSIRKYDKGQGWALIKFTPDFWWYADRKAQIDYCPYCGKRLCWDKEETMSVARAKECILEGEQK